MTILILGVIFGASGAGWTSYPTVTTLQGPETFLTTTVNPTNNQQIAASNLVNWTIQTINFNSTGLRPIYVTPIIQPGGMVVLGDSLDVWFVTNTPGFWPLGNTNGVIVCGGTTNAVNITTGSAYYTNGYTLLTGEATTWTNECWLMNLTNFVRQTIGWNLPLDNALCVSGMPYFNFGDPDISLTYLEGYQAWAGGTTYSATGTNTVYGMAGMTNRVVFWGTNDYGTTNDFYFTMQGINYTNPSPGNTYTTNIFLTGTYGANVTGQIIGAPNSLISVRDYPTRWAGNWGSGGTGRQYCPPLYANTLANDPLIYLTNISPIVTGIPKALFLPGSQNDRGGCDVRKGTNNSPVVQSTNAAMAQANHLANLARIGRSLGFSPIIGAYIPYSPTSVGSAQFNTMNYVFSLPTVQTNFDIFYDWGASNSVYQANGSYYVDGTHPNATLARIQATNSATFFKVKQSASIK